MRAASQTVMIVALLAILTVVAVLAVPETVQAVDGCPVMQSAADCEDCCTTLWLNELSACPESDPGMTDCIRKANRRKWQCESDCHEVAW